jgi:hypothetical protein
MSEGGFQPGISGNPGGRSKTATLIRQKAESFCDEALEVIRDVMRNPAVKGGALRLAAANALLDRGVGKAMSPATLDVSVQLRQRLVDMTPEELQRFQQSYLAATADTPLLEDSTSDDMPSADGESHVSVLNTDAIER